MSFKIGTIENNLSAGKLPAQMQTAPEIKIFDLTTKDKCKEALRITIEDFKNSFGFYDEILSAHYRAVFESDDLTEIKFITDSVISLYIPEFLSLASSNKEIGFCKYQSIRKLNEFYNSQGVEPITPAPGTALDGLGSFWKGVWKILKPALIIGVAIVGTVLTSGALGVAVGWGTASAGVLIATGVGLASQFIQNPNTNIGEAFNNALPGFFSTMANIATTGNISLNNITPNSNLTTQQQEALYDFVSDNSNALSNEYLANTDFETEKNNPLPLILAGAGLYTLIA